MRIRARELIGEMRQEAASKQTTAEMARRWFDLAQEMLLDRGGDYEAWGGSSPQAEVHSVVQSGSPPRWVGERWEFGFGHFAAALFEYGSEPHVIRPKDAKMLKFPWPDAPDEVREKFEPKWRDPDHWLEEPEVLMPEVHHPGTPELRYLRDSRDQMRREAGTR